MVACIDVIMRGVERCQTKQTKNIHNITIGYGIVKWQPSPSAPLLFDVANYFNDYLIGKVGKFRQEMPTTNS